MVEIWGFAAAQQDISIESEDESRALFSSVISSLLALRLKGYMDYGGITEIPCPCLFALEIFTHEGDRMKCLFAFSTNLFVLVLVGFLCQLGLFLSPSG